MRNRCVWSQSNKRMQTYHDEEWGKPSWDDRYLFEMLCLEGAQTGLSWNIVLSKRQAYIEAWRQFDLAYCAALTDETLETIKADYGVIKHAAKLSSIRTNAQAVINIQKEWGSLAEFLWNFVGEEPIYNNWDTDELIPTQTPLSVELSKALKKRGVKFVGPVTTYSFMQAVGMVDDHVKNCICNRKYRK